MPILYRALLILILCNLAGPGLPQSSAQKSRLLQSLTTIDSVVRLGNDRARSAYPVHIRGEVTYVDAEWGMLFLRDSSGSIFASIGRNLKLKIGDAVDLAGVTSPGAVAPVVVASSVKVVGHQASLLAKASDLASLQSGAEDGAYVVTSGILRPGTPVWNHTSLLLVDGSTSLPILIPGGRDNPKALSMIGTKVMVRAVCGSQLDSNNRRIGAELFVGSSEEIHVEEPNWKGAFETPVLSIRQVEDISTEGRLIPAVHIRGTVLWVGAGAIVLEDGSGSVYIESSSEMGFDRGTILDAVGFPEVRQNSIVLADAAIHTLGTDQFRELSFVSRSVSEAVKYGRDGDSVQLSGKLISQELRGKNNIFVLKEHGKQFEVLVAAATSGNNLVTVIPGSVLQASGTLRIVRHRNGVLDSIQLLVDSPSRIVIKNDREINWRLLLSIVGAFTAAGVLLWIVQLRRALRIKTRLIRQQLEHEAKLESRYRRLFERNLAAVFSWLPSGEITDCNQAFVQLLGCDAPSQVIGKSYWAFLKGESRIEVGQALQRGEINGREISLRRADGDTIYLLENTTFVETESEGHYETTALDVTQARQAKLELQRARDEAQHESENDPLTGLANRRFFSQLVDAQLETAAIHQQPFALLYLDLDGFKAVNDTLGHVVGDLLLQKVAARLSSHMFSGDTLCRIGGDEFAVLLTRPESVTASHVVAGDMLKALDHPVEVGDQEITIGASIGISKYPELASDYITLLQQADSAMYVAKREGKNRAVMYSHEIGTAEYEKNLILSELKGAVARREISVKYQPEFDVQGDTLVRFEALARWENRVLGTVPPDKFIPIAEENGIIAELSAYILEMACKEAVAWQRATGQSIPVAVNISTVQLRSDTFVNEVLAILKRAGLAPESLELEMTESIMLDGVGRSREMLHQLRKSGIGLALDDFGIGYSCLSYLRDLPFDRLKVDRSFLRRATQGNDGEALINAVVSVAHALKMPVVLEGIETLRDLEFAKKLGVDEVQGFLLGRPSSDPLSVILGQAAKEAIVISSQYQPGRCSRTRSRRDRLSR